MSAQPNATASGPLTWKALNEIRGQLLRGAIKPTLVLADGTTIELPTVWDTCPKCHGDDNTTCYCKTCHGRSVVRAIDVDALSPEIREAYNREHQSLAEYLP